MMNKLSPTLVLTLLLSILSSTPTLAHSSEDTVSIKLGGSSDRSSTMFNSNISYVNKSSPLSSYQSPSYQSPSYQSPYSQYIDFDSIYRNVNNRTTTDLYDVYGKVNYNLPSNIDKDGRNYLQASARLQHNPGVKYHDIIVVGIGHGYRIIHNSDIRVSMETSIAQAESISDTGGSENGDDNTRLNQTILRESIWASYNLGNKSNISDKLLLEEGGKIHYIKNLLVIEYKIDRDVYISLSHTWIQDIVNRGLVNVTSVNLGMKF